MIICFDHFTENGYTINPSQFGLLTSGKTDIKFRRTMKRGVVPSIYPTSSYHQRNNLFNKKNSLGQLAKSRGISIPKTARPSLAYIKN